MNCGFRASRGLGDSPTRYKNPPFAFCSPTQTSRSSPPLRIRQKGQARTLFVSNKWTLGDKQNRALSAHRSVYRLPGILCHLIVSERDIIMEGTHVTEK